MSISVKDAFLACLEMPEAARERYLHDLEEDSRREVLVLLEAHGDSEGLFEHCAPDEEETRKETGELRRRLGSFLVGDVLGRGGMGVVYRAQQDHPRREVALKVLSALEDEDRRRFVVEAEALARVEHPAITRIHEAGEVEENGASIPFIAMEFVEGVRLQDWVSRERPSTTELLDLMRRIAEGVDHAHRCGIIHRDLKPSNILVTPEGAPKIIDFGVARIESASRDLTMEGAVLGTVAYMAPEQASGRAKLIDARCDQYALGVITHEALTGRLPIDVRDMSLAEAARAIQERAPERLDLRGFALDDDLEWVLARALAKSPDDRYESTAALARDFGRLAQGERAEALTTKGLLSLRRLLLRNRMAAGFLLMIALLLGVFGFQQWKTNRSLRDSEEETSRALARAESALSAQSVALDGEREARATLAKTVRALEQEREVARLALAEAEEEANRALGVEGTLETVLFGTMGRDGGLNPELTVGQLIAEGHRNLRAQEGAPAVQASARMTIGRLWLSIGKPQIAAEHLETALKALGLKPKSRGGRMLRTQCHAARVECFRLLGNKEWRDLELELMRESTALLSGNDRDYWAAEYYALRGDICLDEGKLTALRAAAKEAAESLGRIEDEKMNSMRTPELYLKVAFLLLESGDAAGALVELEGPVRAVVERWPRATSVLTHRALLLRTHLARRDKERTFAEGREVLGELAKERPLPRLAELRVREALSLAGDQGMPGLDHLGNLERVIELVRETGRPVRISVNLANKAFALRDRGRFEEALASANEAIAVVENIATDPAQRALADAVDRQLGCFLALKRFEDGIASAQRLVALRTRFEGASSRNAITGRIYHGYCLAKCERREEALAILEAAERDARRVGDRSALERMWPIIRSLKKTGE